MKAKETDKAPVTGPLLKSLVDADKANRASLSNKPSVSENPIEPANLYQDAGGGYNPDFTFPQE